MKTQQKLIRIGLSVALILASVISIPAFASDKTLEQLREEISALTQEINSLTQKANELAEKAVTIEQQISALQTELANIQAQIDLKEAEHAQIVLDIANIEARIKTNSDIISVVISQYYYNSEVSTIERLASAESFASYIDNEMRLGNLADSVVSIIEENKRLREESIEKKAIAESMLQDMAAQRELLAQKRAEQNALLAQTRADEASFNAQRAESQKRRSELESEQQEILRQMYANNNSSGPIAGDPNKGGYPYSDQCPAAKMNGTQYGDRWGMYICECVSYTAWRVYNAYGYMPYWGGRGDANQWISNAIAAGYVVSDTPRVGAVGVTSAGPYGHVVWVEAVNGDRVHISQYNMQVNGVWGEYSEADIDANAYKYIYFDQRVRQS